MHSTHLLIKKACPLIHAFNQDTEIVQVAHKAYIHALQVHCKKTKKLNLEGQGLPVHKGAHLKEDRKRKSVWVRRTTKAFKAQQAREHDEEKLGGL
jgi:hypothetical protein